MHVAAKVGLLAGGIGLGAFAGHKLDQIATRQNEAEDKAVLADTAKAKADWEKWSSALEAQFPGRRLDTPADHARFEQFLRDNPAPLFIKLEHAEFNRIKVSSGSVLGPQHHRNSEEIKMVGYGGIGLSGMAGLGGTMAMRALRTPGSTNLFKTIGMTAGGGLLVASSLMIGASLIEDVRDRTPSRVRSSCARRSTREPDTFSFLTTGPSLM